MLRGGTGRRAMENLIKTHNNCMLLSDRLRFKKSKPADWYNSKPTSQRELHSRNYPAVHSINLDEGYKGKVKLMNKMPSHQNVYAILGWRHPTNRLAAWTSLNGDALKSPLRSSYKVGGKMVNMLATVPVSAEAEDTISTTEWSELKQWSHFRLCT